MINYLAEIDTPGTGAVSVILALFGMLIGIFWLIFPFIVISKANEIIRELKRINSEPSSPGRTKTINPSPEASTK